MTTVQSTRAAIPGDGDEFDILNVCYFGKPLQVSLCFNLLKLQDCHPPLTATRHMRYIPHIGVVGHEVVQALKGAAAGDSVVLLCGDTQVYARVRSFLQQAV
ncbi:hypothetical protein [Pseudomonas vranovensis]|uniref:hypothetical protein n=1 Tax=Pseudomonas vranovensis TaxID=321661 RepID=UPI0003FFAE6C|nr:hypothetical protein [Pseudomonas vranovensis]